MKQAVTSVPGPLLGGLSVLRSLQIPRLTLILLDKLLQC
jgi:hypothetical protein